MTADFESEIIRLQDSIKNLNKKIKEGEARIAQLDKEIDEQKKLNKYLDKKAKRSSFWLFWLLSKGEK